MYTSYRDASLEKRLGFRWDAHPLIYTLVVRAADQTCGGETTQAVRPKKKKRNRCDKNKKSNQNKKRKQTHLSGGGGAIHKSAFSARILKRLPTRARKSPTVRSCFFCS